MNPKERKYVVFTKHKLVNSWSVSSAVDAEDLEDVKSLFGEREFVIYKRVEDDEIS